MLSVEISILLRCSQTPSTAIPSLSILSRLSPLATCHLLHLYEPSTWRRQVVFFPLGDPWCPRVVNKVFRPSDFPFSRGRRPSLHSSDESLVGKMVTEKPLLHRSLRHRHHVFLSIRWWPRFTSVYYHCFNKVVFKREHGPDALRTWIMLQNLCHPAELRRAISCWRLWYTFRSRPS